MSVIRNKTVDIIIHTIPTNDYRGRGFCGYEVVCKQVVSHEGTRMITTAHNICELRGVRSRKQEIERRRYQKVAFVSLFDKLR